MRTLPTPSRAAPATVIAVAALLASACTLRQDDERAAEHAAAVEQAAGADSLVLERTGCYGSCPAYRVRLAADGSVAFQSRHPGDTTRAEGAAADPRALDSLARRAVAIRLRSFPDTIAKDSALCRLRATDHPQATVRLHFSDGSKTVVDYQGCFDAGDRATSPRLASLRAFEAAVDSLTGAARWARAGERR